MNGRWKEKPLFEALLWPKCCLNPGGPCQYPEYPKLGLLLEIRSLSLASPLDPTLLFPFERLEKSPPLFVRSPHCQERAPRHLCQFQLQTTPSQAARKGKRPQLLEGWKLDLRKDFHGHRLHLFLLQGCVE